MQKQPSLLSPCPTRHASHLGVYALIPSDDGASILLIKKALGCYTGLYDLPGGSMEDAELLEETLQREVLEETNCTITSYQHLASHSLLYPHDKDGEHITLRHIGIIYLAEITGTPRDHANGDDSAGCVWVPLRTLTEDNAAPLVRMAVESWRAR